jgi:NAD(P)-dependent dehydrogenase (short-subunit alcohol dehydrogenase family)
MGRLDDKVAVITGGASGIGAGTAEHFVREGARVVVADIQEEEGRAVAKSLGDAGAFALTDVTREQDVQAAVELAVSHFGRLDIMFNNAGILGPKGSICECPAEELAVAVDVNLKGVFFGMKHAGRVLAEQGSGSILSTSSVAGTASGAGPHVYSTTKAAIIHLTRSVALELGERGVRVNCICPGGVPTPFVLAVAGAPPEAMEGIRKGMSRMQPLGRAGETIDIARAAVWLCSEEGDYVTGQAITVDGGESLGKMWSKRHYK